MEDSAMDADDSRGAAVELFWIPLGAGGHFVAVNGRAYEALRSRIEHRPVARLVHAALLVRCEGKPLGIEQAPAWGPAPPDRRVVAEGPVGIRLAGRLRLFRYEVRVVPGGAIPDIAEAVADPVVLAEEEARARAVLAAVEAVPRLVWGRAPVGGEMWNSNSVIAWSLVRAGIEAGRIEPPTGCRAPGWASGVALARRRA
jgi:hypothetical protein